MKTTIDIPDELYPQIAQASTAAGKSVEAFVVALVIQHAGDERTATATPKKFRQPSEVPAHLSDSEQIQWLRDNVAPEHLGLMAAFGTVDAESVAELKRFIEEEFSQIDPELWE